MNTSTELASKVTVDQIVATYQDAVRKVDKGYALLAEAQKELTECMGAHYSDFVTVDHYARLEGSKAADNVKAKIKKNVWKLLIDRLGIRKVLSVKRAEELDKKFNDDQNGRVPDQFPEITASAVFDMLNSMTGSADEFAQEAVMEVWEFLHPSSWKKYATNERYAKFELGKKVILSWWVEGSYSQSAPYRAIYQKYAEYRALDRVFHLMDGKGIPAGYNSPLIDAINTSPDGRGETEYFSFRACQNRNLHLEFKRLDLVNQLNQIASDQTRLKDGKKRK